MKRPVPAQTVDKQRRASDPNASAWVSAHAGSGKTHVLTQRVVRLLLDGVEPSKIVCLTFTKAAAANMSERVFRTLAKWALLPDDDLRRAIGETGAAAPNRLDRARRLFATAVETPGGLKIQTIHAFCERILHLFPFEANVPADFRVVEDLERAELMASARRATLAAAADDARLGAALARVADETWDGGFEKAVEAMLSDRESLRDEDRLAANLRARLGLCADESEDALAREIVEGGIPCSEWPTLVDTLMLGSTNDRKAAERLRPALALAPDKACVAHYFALFFTDEKPRATIATKNVEAIAPGLPARLLDEGARLLKLQDRLRAVAAFERSMALVALSADVLRRYEASKRARSLLDFDDLIARTRALLKRDGASSWVLYKLDNGVDHILVDEAQDTSRAQWDILSALADEFTAGAGARAGARRSFFAVGDEKQSIFSFQGAAPAEFGRMKGRFGQRIVAADQTFHAVELDLSFRSAPEILKAVDAVFAAPAANRGLTVEPDRPPRHEALKQDVRGMVEIWRPLRADRAPPPEEWTLPVDLPRDTDPRVDLANRIALKIRAMIASDSRERVAGEAPHELRPITAGDVMILVRRRNAFFDAMVRALKEHRVPVAGADRLDVGGHIAVMDMTAAARAALAPDDDLTLACVLKSPLIGLTDDDLLAIAPNRAGSLWRALAASDAPAHRAAAGRIEGWRAAARDARPFDFFSRLLGPEGGRKAFLGRLGPEAGDALDELMSLALAHERQEAPSLVAFVHEIETIDLTVKRDMDAAGGLVRVMTAHAAKGLEAKVVFLPDTCAAPSGSLDPAVFTLGEDEDRAVAWSQRKDDDAPAIAERRDRLRIEADDEYRRLLYVAMTRAEERLYICGYVGSRDPSDACWHTLVSNALAGMCEEVAEEFAPDGTALRYGVPLLADERAATPAAASPDLPDWLFRPAPAEAAPRPPLRPSTALAAAEAPEAEPAGGEAAGRQRGLIVHALLQNLPETPPERRRAAALRYIGARAPGLPGGEAEALAGEALRALERPECAPLFGKNSRAETAIAARIPRKGGGTVDVVGRIDRLVELATEVWIVDFKTGARRDAGAYTRQLALYRAAVGLLYPSRRVRAFLLWTSETLLEEAAASDLDAALAAI